MTTDNVYHDGEIAVQEKAGVCDFAQRLSQMIRPLMPEQHREFFQKLPFVLVGLTDGQGRPWTTLCIGTPGFIETPDDASLHIAGLPLLADELGFQLNVGDKIGLLGIELPTRRRNRMNGAISTTDEDGFVVRVEQSFGNCPQYIQTRSVEPNSKISAAPNVTIEKSSTLFDHAKALIERADTFYISSRTSEFSSDPSTGVDASHRGGRPGFVNVSEQGVLSFPDFSGNRLFNTLGNIADDGRVGITFPDFETGDLLLVAGRAEIVWDGPRLKRFEGAQRLVDVQVEEVVYVASALPLSGSLIEPSPKLARTGSWQ